MGSSGEVSVLSPQTRSVRIQKSILPSHTWKPHVIHRITCWSYRWNNISERKKQIHRHFRNNYWSGRSEMGLPISTEHLKRLPHNGAQNIANASVDPYIENSQDLAVFLQFHILPDIICLQETHVSAKCQPNLPNYTILCRDRPFHVT